MTDTKSERFSLHPSLVCLARNWLPANRTSGWSLTRRLRRIHWARSRGAISSIHSIGALRSASRRSVARSWGLRTRAGAHGAATWRPWVRARRLRSWSWALGAYARMASRAHRSAHRGLRTCAVRCHGTASGRSRASLRGHWALAWVMRRSMRGSTGRSTGRSGRVHGGARTRSVLTRARLDRAG